MEADYQTIDLNRTAVGFSHGDNTFGWRFYPRFQTPEIPGNLKAIGKDLLGGRAFTNHTELHQRKLEPGQRECMAMVIMPSIVPFAEINISSSWFSLTNPKHKSHSTIESVQLSKRLHAIETVCPKGDEACYQPGELSRLQAKAKMLAARLPLQDMKFPVPYENTLGGFEFFNSGITDLSPQLRGWYGAAGYEGKSVELFLMGDNFNIANTNVIAGGQKIENYRLISRQVLAITIPANATVSEDPKPGISSESGKYIDIRLATPYGIAGPLKFPTLDKASGKPPMAPALSAPVGNQRIELDRSTDLILSGSNFTADTRAFAGGKSCTVEVVSDSVLKVSVPKGVTTLTQDGKPFVELKAANAGGVSNAIAIPVNKPAVTATKSKVVFSAPKLTLGFEYKGLGIVPSEEPNRRPPELTLDMDKNDATTKPAAGDVSVTFNSPTTGEFVIKVPYDGVKNQLADFSIPLKQKLFELCSAKFGPENTSPPVPIALTATYPSKMAGAISVQDSITIEWVNVAKAKE